LALEITSRLGDSCPFYDNVFQQPVNGTFTFFPGIHKNILNR